MSDKFFKSWYLQHWRKRGLAGKKSYVKIENELLFQSLISQTMIVKFRATSPSNMAIRVWPGQGQSPGFLTPGSVLISLCGDMTSDHYSNNDTALRKLLSVISSKSLTSQVSSSFTEGKVPAFQLADIRDSGKLHP